MGVKIDHIEVGTGKTPKKFDIVEIHYVGYLQGGLEPFASSLKDFGKPFRTEIGTGKVITGWDDGILNMREGGKALLEVSSDSAYGANGYPPVIPQHANLKYKIELLKVIKAPEKAKDVKGKKPE